MNPPKELPDIDKKIENAFYNVRVDYDCLPEDGEMDKFKSEIKALIESEKKKIIDKLLELHEQLNSKE